MKQFRKPLELLKNSLRKRYFAQLKTLSLEMTAAPSEQTGQVKAESAFRKTVNVVKEQKKWVSPFRQQAAPVKPESKETKPKPTKPSTKITENAATPAEVNKEASAADSVIDSSTPQEDSKQPNHEKKEKEVPVDNIIDLGGGLKLPESSVLKIAQEKLSKDLTAIDERTAEQKKLVDLKNEKKKELAALKDQNKLNSRFAKFKKKLDLEKKSINDSHDSKIKELEASISSLDKQIKEFDSKTNDEIKQSQEDHLENTTAAQRAFDENKATAIKDTEAKEADHLKAISDSQTNQKRNEIAARVLKARQSEYELKLELLELQLTQNNRELEKQNGTNSEHLTIKSELEEKISTIKNAIAENDAQIEKSKATEQQSLHSLKTSEQDLAASKAQLTELKTQLETLKGGKQGRFSRLQQAIAKRHAYDEEKEKLRIETEEKAKAEALETLRLEEEKKKREEEERLRLEEETRIRKEKEAEAAKIAAEKAAEEKRIADAKAADDARKLEALKSEEVIAAQQAAASKEAQLNKLLADKEAEIELLKKQKIEEEAELKKLHSEAEKANEKSATTATIPIASAIQSSETNAVGPSSIAKSPVKKVSSTPEVSNEKRSSGLFGIFKKKETASEESKTKSSDSHKLGAGATVATAAAAVTAGVAGAAAVTASAGKEAISKTNDIATGIAAPNNKSVGGPEVQPSATETPKTESKETVPAVEQPEASNGEALRESPVENLTTDIKQADSEFNTSVVEKDGDKVTLIEPTTPSVALEEITAEEAKGEKDVLLVVADKGTTLEPTSTDAIPTPPATAETIEPPASTGKNAKKNAKKRAAKKKKKAQAAGSKEGTPEATPEPQVSDALRSTTAGDSANTDTVVSTDAEEFIDAAEQPSSALYTEPAPVEIPQDHKFSVQPSAIASKTPEETIVKSEVGALVSALYTEPTPVEIPADQKFTVVSEQEDSDIVKAAGTGTAGAIVAGAIALTEAKKTVDGPESTLKASEVETDTPAHAVETPVKTLDSKVTQSTGLASEKQNNNAGSAVKPIETPSSPVKKQANVATPSAKTSATSIPKAEKRKSLFKRIFSSDSNSVAVTPSINQKVAASKPTSVVTAPVKKATPVVEKADELKAAHVKPKDYDDSSLYSYREVIEDE